MPQAHKGARVQLTLRIPADLHRAAAIKAKVTGRSMNDVLVLALREGLDTPGDLISKAHIQITDDDGNRVGFL